VWVVECRGRFHRNAQLGCSGPHPLLTKCLPRLLGFPNVYTVAIVSLPSREMGDASDRRRVHPSHFVFRLVVRLHTESGKDDLQNDCDFGSPFSCLQAFNLASRAL
jgi:hypothetical protein